ncbi:unnamed protein product, partial [Nesidiocoris tenuis]
MDPQAGVCRSFADGLSSRGKHETMKTELVNISPEGIKLDPIAEITMKLNVNSRRINIRKPRDYLFWKVSLVPGKGILISYLADMLYANSNITEWLRVLINFKGSRSEGEFRLPLEMVVPRGVESES